MLLFIRRPCKGKTRTQSSERGVVATGKEQSIANTTAIRVLKAIGMPYHYSSRSLTWCSS